MLEMDIWDDPRAGVSVSSEISVDHLPVPVPLLRLAQERAVAKAAPKHLSWDEDLAINQTQSQGIT